MGTSRRKAGPLGPEVDGYRAWLAQRGYTEQTVRNMLQYLGHLGRWLRVHGLDVSDLDEQRVAAFLADRQVGGLTRVSGSACDGAVAGLSAGGRRGTAGTTVDGAVGRAA